MGIFIDIALPVVMAFIIFSAYKAGFVKAVMGLIRSLVAFFAAYSFSPTLGEWISEKFLLKKISSGISGTIMSLSETQDGYFNLQGMVNNMDSALKSIIKNYNVDGNKLSKMCEGMTCGTEEHVRKVADFIAEPISQRISYCIAFITLFITVFVLLIVLTIIVDKIFRLPVLKTVNRIFGLLLGIAQALAVAFVFCTAVVSLLFWLGSIDSEMFGLAAIEKSFILRLFIKIFPSGSLFGLF